MDKQKSDATLRKENRARYGVNEGPISAVKAYRKPMSFDHAHVLAIAWILIRPDGKRTHVNTYNGAVGKNASFEESTYDMPEGKKLRALLKGYEEVPVTECPVAVAADTETLEPGDEEEGEETTSEIEDDEDDTEEDPDTDEDEDQDQE